MKRNQLLGALALMLATGMTFPTPKTTGVVFALPESTRLTLLPAKEKGKDDDQGDRGGALAQRLGQLAISCLNGGPLDVYDPSAVANTRDFWAAVERGETQITLACDLRFDRNLEINRDELVINLNGHRIIALTPNLRVLDIKRGDVTLVGPGEIIAYGEGSVAIRISGALAEDVYSYAKVTISDDVALYAPTSYGIIVSPNAHNAAHGVEINLKGKIVAHDGIYINDTIITSPSAPLITIADNAAIVADDETGVALDAAGYGVWRVGRAVLSGATGLQVKTGQLTLTNAEVAATDTALQFVENYDIYQAGARVEIAGGNYLSSGGYAIASDHELRNAPNQLRRCAIAPSIFSDVAISGQLGVLSPSLTNARAQEVISIQGGQFNSDITPFSAPDSEVYRDAEGFYHVAPTAPPSATAESDQLTEAKLRLAEAILAIQDLQPTDFGDGFDYDSLPPMISDSTRLLTDQATTMADLQNAVCNLAQALSYLA